MIQTAFVVCIPVFPSLTLSVFYLKSESSLSNPIQFLFFDRERHCWLFFTNPVQIISVRDADRVMDQLNEIEKAIAKGRIAAGFVGYEAASAFDASYVTHPAQHPLMWFGLFEEAHAFTKLPDPDLPFTLSPWQANIDESQYLSDIQKIKDLIASGDTYQVNHTYRLNAQFEGDAYSLFHNLVHNQPNTYAAFLETPDFAICSVSPELFFRLEGDTILCRPMKGTTSRGLSNDQDLEQKNWLAQSPKNQAENVMIVDMVRSDLGHIAAPGTVEVPTLFELEQYPTLWQMTSTVKAKTSVSVPEIFKALFPCASITGAPKTRTMEIIRNLESAPRHLYTGSIGYWTLDREAVFNVAIRSTWIDKLSGQAEYGVGGGIVWDSDAQHEFHETQVKAKVLFEKQRDFKILETILWREAEGYSLLDEHIKRMKHSARYFDFPFDEKSIRQLLHETSEGFKGEKKRIRLLLDRSGYASIEAYDLIQNTNNQPVHLRLALKLIDIQSPFVYHKTTIRSQYLADSPLRQGVDDLLFWNEKGEITETSIYNIVVRIDNHYFTPPVACGLLPGTMRQSLLDDGTLEERIILKKELPSATELFVINSVRGWQPAVLIA